MARLRLSLLGTFQASLDGRPLEHFASDKVRALLAYLVVEADRPHSREALATLLWPDYPQKKALYYLRNALSNLRKLLEERAAGTPFLWVTLDTLQFNASSDYWLDVDAFQRLAEPADTQSILGPSELTLMESLVQAGSLYTGDFLAGFSIGSLPFEEWALLKREGLHQIALETLHRLGELYLATGEYEKAGQIAHRQVGLEPWREEAYQQWMRALALAGQRSEALKRYETCSRHLADNLGVLPGKETVRLYEAIRDGKLIPVTPLKKLHNLPAAITSFIGREPEIATITRLLLGESGNPVSRLVTLTGAGGVGKTRLAIQTAARLVGQFTDGVWLVELAPVADPDLVPTITARSLGLREQIGPQVISLLQDYLGARQTLLILDNCEHLVKACASLADSLLSACQSLSILVTSREALGIAGEMLFYVPSLSLPELNIIDGSITPMPLEALQKYEAIHLFQDRASAATAGFTLNPTNATAISQICTRLDGIPLAIELAAACTRVLQVDEIVKRLDDRFNLLTSGSRTALPRYQTLRASIAWSYDLLSKAESGLLQRLSVFAGGWTLEAAESVGCDEEIKSCQVLRLLNQLVNKSLIQTGNSVAGLYRFRMLETIRQYAHEKLVGAGLLEAARDRHLQYYLTLAEKAKGALRGPEQPLWLIRLGIELDNLRLALARSLESRGQPGWDPEPGLRLAAALWWFWHPRGQLVEGMGWVDRLLTAEKEDRGERPLSPSRCKSRAEALMVVGNHTLMMGEHRQSIQYSEESLILFSQLGKEGRKGVAYTLYNLGGVASHQGDLHQATRLLNESLAIARQEGDLFTQAEVLMTMGTDAMNNRDYDRAKALYKECLALRKEMGDRDGEIGFYFLSGRLAFEQGEDERARAYFFESQQVAYAIGNQFAAGFHLPFLGQLEWTHGKYDKATEFFNELLLAGRKHADVSSAFIGLISLGKLALSRGEYSTAQSLFTECLALCQQNDCQLLIAFSLYYLGVLAWAQEDAKEAFQLFNQVMENSRRNQEPYTEILALFGLHRSALAVQDYGRARRYFEKLIEAWKRRRTASPPWTLPVYLEPFAYLESGSFIALAENRLALATRLLSATAAYADRHQRERTPKERAMRENGIAYARAGLGDSAFAAAWDEGRKLTLEQAVEEITNT